MKQEEPKWLSRWDVQELPTLDELVPLTKALIPPDLALAFDIPAHINSNSDYVAPAAEAVSGGGGGSDSFHQRQTPPLQPSQSQSQSHSQSLSQQQQQMDYDSSDVAGGVGGDEHERTLKKPRLVWTPQLHKRFVDAVGHLGIKNAVPKTIMQLMGVEGLKRENVASHLQKYRLYLKRMQGGHPSGGLNGSISAADSAMDHLFASAPVPNHFLNRVPQQPQPASIPGSVPFTAPPGAGAMHPQHHHHQQMLAAATHHYQHCFWFSGLLEEEAHDKNSLNVNDDANCDETRRSLYDEANGLKSSIVSGFQLASSAGPLCDEPMWGMAFLLEAYILPEKSATVSSDHYDYGIFAGQVMTTVKEACRSAVLLNKPRIVEGMYFCDLITPTKFLGPLHAFLGGKRARILKQEMQEGCSLFTVHAYIPVAESFGFTELLRKSTSGASSGLLMFSHWEVHPEDPFFIPKTEDEIEEFGDGASILPNTARKLIDAVRYRKGLSVEEKVVQHATKQRTLARKV